MKKQNLKSQTFLLYILFGFFLSTNIYCKKENAKINPEKAILGKWKITQNSYGNINNTDEYTEYLRDSIYQVYNAGEDTSYKGKYWLVDSMLFTQYIYLDQNTGATLLIDTLPYKFKFTDRNTLQLKLQFPAIITDFTFKRLIRE